MESSALRGNDEMQLSVALRVKRGGFMLMQNKKSKVAIVLSIILGLFLTIPCEVAFARDDGGGGGHGSRYSWLGVLIAIIYIIVQSWLIKRKKAKAATVLQKLSNSNDTWDEDRIKGRIEEVFFKVRIAWMERNQDIAQEYMSEKIYEKHKMQTDLMLKQNKKNILENINLTEIDILQVADYVGDEKDKIWVRIQGSMIDYIINEKSGEILSGDKNTPEEFEELWKFVKSPNGWISDEIDQEVSISDLLMFNSFSDENRA